MRNGVSCSYVPSAYPAMYGIQREVIRNDSKAIVKQTIRALIVGTNFHFSATLDKARY